MRKVIAFCGFEQSGKDYSCQRLMMTMGFKKVAFADALRESAFKIIGVPYEEGMKRYEELKHTELINGLTFRNILENLGSAIRIYDKDFWARAVVEKIKETPRNVCISDLRYPNEYTVVQRFCEENNISFKLIFCDYKSPLYNEDNPHESAKMARFLKDRGYKDQEEVLKEDIKLYENLERIENEKSIEF